ncbi:MAG: hypothetical protein UT05_C0007G0010 [Parcubacteria group bacterium GW2011_GWF2_38_76]|nr:MAG: hypothetical protein UT05_C0007G0010 [Parcubacteria group bacterium GW2011_GWF2_38_76]HBM46115.1 hypothetical protein [Patescibacteria group bacterium]
MNTQTIDKGMVRLGDTEALQSFKQGVDDMLLRRSYFISQVMPKLKEGQDYYTIKGKKSLGKSGCEKIAGIFNFSATFVRDNDTMDAFKSIPGLIAYICTLYRDDKIVGQGRGASTLDKNNGDPNKTIKMSSKSAFIDAVIRTTSLADIFSQDLEDMPTNNTENVPKEVPITDRQKELLSVLIKRHVHDGEEKGKWLTEIPNMTKAEASDTISSFIGIK